MKFWNHFKIGKLIHKSMKNNGMPLNKILFIYGNLAPDVSLSYIFRNHSRDVSASYLDKQLRYLYAGNHISGCAMFSYSLGIMSHYICDFLCYPHTPAFDGGTREHYIHEKTQTVNICDMLPYSKRAGKGLNLDKLTKALDSYISRREKMYAQSSEIKYGEIPYAIYIATWASGNVYLNASEKTTVSRNRIIYSGSGVAASLVKSG